MAKKKKAHSDNQHRQSQNNSRGTPIYVRVGAMILVIILIVSMVVMYAF